MSLYIYLIPISPDANEFLTAILKIVLPVLLMNRVNNLFEKVKRDKLKQDYKEKNYVYLLANKDDKKRSIFIKEIQKIIEDNNI